MAIPKHKCYVCHRSGKWTIYVIWDSDNPQIGAGKRKWWICPECNEKQDKEDNNE